MGNICLRLVFLFLLTLFLSDILIPTTAEVLLRPRKDKDETQNNGTIPSKCLLERPQPAERVWYEDGEIIPVVIETSNKSSQLVVTYVLAILYTEVLGLRDVDIVHSPGAMDITSVMQRLSGCSNAKPWQCNDNNVAPVPESMISIETWIDINTKDTADDWVSTGLVSDAGQLGTAGRYGWYEPDYVVEYIWDKYKKIGDDWRILTFPEVNELFWIDPVTLDELTLRTDRDNERYCEDPDCVDGVYRPSNCPRNESNCAVLLAEYTDVNKDTLIGQIESLELNVSIAWIGPKIDSYVNYCHDRLLPVLFLNWVSNGITSTGNYSRITFPNCLGNSEDNSCDFKLNVLEKYAWHRVEWGLANAYSVLEDMEFSQVEMDSILRDMYVNELSEQQAACVWVQENEHIWIEWIPGVVVNQTIYLGGMFSNSGFVWPDPGIEPAARMAIEAVNADPDILSIYNLDMHSYDAQCNDQQAMLAYLHYLTDVERTKVGIVGPACSAEAETVAGMAKYFRNIMISYSTESPKLSSRELYPYFYRTYPSATDHADCYVEFFEYFDWTQCATLTEDGQDFIPTVNLLNEALATNDIEVISSRKFPAYQHSLDMSLYISEIKNKDLHIVIGNFFDYAARAVFCEAYRQGTTAHEGFQWFIPAWFQEKWWDTDYYNSPAHSPQESVPCTTAQMEIAVQGLIAFSATNMQHENKEVVGGYTVKEFYDAYHEIVDTKGIPPSSYAPYAYDTVWAFAIALDRLLEYDVFALSTITSNETVQAYMDFIDDTDFDGLTGNVFFRGPDRVSTTDILQIFPNMTTNIGLYIPVKKNETDQFILHEDLIIWVTGQPPTDGKSDYIPCAFGEGLRKALDTECSTVIVIVNLFIIISVVLLVLVTCLIFKKRYDRKVKATDERIKELGLKVNEGFLAMDEWEMPRESVVLNRKLGEGAFGMVYGGEALLEEQWLAVAVKTLKVGSSIEDKLDFLSEAEMMKQLDHVNIVSLLGVCTRGEPAYAVMEYMLHGDLKTFLLSRRHFVSQSGEINSDEISPERLTEMAFDVAAGLDYLSSLNFVHRDLACRNCLVHASHVVKIGDFGMTRPLYDSDYYRFDKKGMLPVRWMSPESLIDGIFTFKSDIWSLGVVFYEIVTFGSFPYQGLSNTQVLEALKNQEILKPPEGCNVQLKELFEKCWSIDPDERPTPLQIMELLGEHPSLITPCLYLPSSCKETSITTDPPPPLPPRRNRNKHRMQSPPMKRKYGGIQRSHSTRTPQMQRRQAERYPEIRRNTRRSSTLTKQDVDLIRKIQQSKHMMPGRQRKISTTKNPSTFGKEPEEQPVKTAVSETRQRRISRVSLGGGVPPSIPERCELSSVGEDKMDVEEHSVQIIISHSEDDDGIGNESVCSDDLSSQSGSESRHQSASSQDSLLHNHRRSKPKIMEISRNSITLADFPLRPSLSMTEIMSTIV